MERRTFLRAAVVAAALAPAAALAAPTTTQVAGADSIKDRLAEWYSAFGNPRVDREHYRSFMTDDYYLLENGELLDVKGDIALLDKLAPDHVRTDRFDFRHVRVDGDHAYAVYFLESDMKDSKDGPRSRRWLESAVFRREGGQWRAAVLHSTRINPPTN